MTDSAKRDGLPGGVLLPGGLFVLAMTGFIVLFKHPDWIDLGGHFSPAGMCVLAAVVTFFWFLVAAGMRRPKPPEG